MFKKLENSIAKTFAKIISNIAYYLPFLDKNILNIRSFYKTTNDFLKINKQVKQIEVYPIIKLSLDASNDLYSQKHEKFSKKDFVFRPQTVIQINQARVIGKDGLLTSPDNHGILDINPMGNISDDLKRILLKSPEFINGNSLFLCSTWSDFYYHWMFDVLPKLHLFEKSGLNANFYIFNEIKHPFQQETLKIIGIEENKIIQTNKYSNFLFEKLIVPSFPGHIGWLPPWGCQYLNNILAKELNIVQNKKIYISRENASQRKIINEKELLEFLDKEGFIKVCLEELSLKEQIKLFKSAEMVIAPHGGGLTNLVFANKGTKVIEIFSPNYINVCYWSLSNASKLDYHYFISDDNLINNNIKVDLSKFKDFFKFVDIQVKHIHEQV